MSSVEDRLVSEQRRDRELALAYRIASARMRSTADQQELVASGAAWAELAARLEALTGRTAPAACHRGWVSVGALEEPAAVLRALTTLERMGEEDLARERSCHHAKPDRECAALDEALRAHRTRRAWLERRAGELERHA